MANQHQLPGVPEDNYHRAGRDYPAACPYCLETWDTEPFIGRIIHYLEYALEG